MNSIAKLLLDKLIDRKILGPDSEIDAVYTGIDMAGQPFVRSRGTFIIRSIRKTETGYSMSCASVVDGTMRDIPDTAIVLIDGMSPDRVAETYGMTPEGEIIPPGRRRGRKPKVREEIPAEEDSEDDA